MWQCIHGPDCEDSTKFNVELLILVVQDALGNIVDADGDYLDSADIYSAECASCSEPATWSEYE